MSLWKRILKLQVFLFLSCLVFRVQKTSLLWPPPSSSTSLLYFPAWGSWEFFALTITKLIFGKSWCWQWAVEGLSILEHPENMFYLKSRLWKKEVKHLYKVWQDLGPDLLESFLGPQNFWWTLDLGYFPCFYMTPFTAGRVQTAEPIATPSKVERDSPFN